MNNLINVSPNMYVDQAKSYMKFLSSNKNLCEISFIYVVERFQIIYVIAIIFNNGFFTNNLLYFFSKLNS